MLRPPDVNFADLQVGTVSQCFSCNYSLLHSRKRLQIYVFFLTRQPIIVSDIVKIKKIKRIKILECRSACHQTKTTAGVFQRILDD